MHYALFMGFRESVTEVPPHNERQPQTRLNEKVKSIASLPHWFRRSFSCCQLRFYITHSHQEGDWNMGSLFSSWHINREIHSSDLQQTVRSGEKALLWLCKENRGVLMWCTALSKEKKEKSIQNSRELMCACSVNESSSSNVYSFYRADSFRSEFLGGLPFLFLL